MTFLVRRLRLPQHASQRCYFSVDESVCVAVRIERVMSEIFIVDDDLSVRTALSVLLSGEGYAVTGFPEGEAFLSVARSRTPRCVLIDVHLPGRSGVEVLKALDAQRYPAPIFVISGQGDIPTAVDAIRHGALDFIEKPFDPAAVVTRVREAIEAWQKLEHEVGILARDFPGHERLTARERQVLERIARGASSKEAGRELAISPRTVEVHRARIMEKLGAKNAADLMRIVLGGGGGKRPVALGARYGAS
jgi:two-component system, LuxR family, response regulator FixJ